MLRSLTKPTTPTDAMGFRLRGLEMTRLEVLVDAAFAFSVTMLALSPDKIPRSFDGMIVLFKGIPAFVASLALLLLFWHGHVRMSRRYGLDDGATSLLSCAFIAVMLVYVYPLKYMIGTFFEFYIPALRAPGFANTFGSSSDLATMFVFMSSGFVGMHLMLALMDRHALRLRVQLGLSDHEVRIARCEFGSSLVYMAVGMASVLLAIGLRNHGTAVVAAGFVYASLGVLMPIYWRLVGPTDADIAEAVKAARADSAESA
ncbi:MAG: TMEM175 family protein [Planctomycetota bacterium]